jgi:hypothetical protein
MTLIFLFSGALFNDVSSVISDGVMIDELGRIWKEVVMA